MKEARNASYILMILATILTSIIIIPMLWMIPMTLAYKRSIDDNEPHTALAICSILFSGGLGLVAGIIMIATYSEKE